MKLRETLSRLDRVQQTMTFKLVATGLIVALSVAALIVYGVYAERARQGLPLIDLSMFAGPAGGAEGAGGAGVAGGAGGAGESGEGADRALPGEAGSREAAAAAIREAAQSTAESINQLLKGKMSLAGFGVGVGLVGAVALAVVWLGLGLTYLGVVLAGVVLAGPLWVLGAPGGVLRGASFFIAGGLALTASFTALIQLLRAVFFVSSPVTGIARNVINEAVRLKLSLVFIVLLIFALAALPQLLDGAAPLRYRVQAFLAYGTGAAFWLIAVLTLLLSVGTVAFEQRDRVIWQTMTKPVRSWEYVLGKWLGVVSVSAALLGVSCAGVFLFTEYLRNQPAHGEVRPFEAARSAETGQAISSDRLLLETQVLTARASVRPTLPAISEEAIAQEIGRRMDALVLEQAGGTLAARDLADLRKTLDTGERRDEMRRQLERELIAQYLSIPPGESEKYRFDGLLYAKRNNLPVTLRYRVNAGSNLPTDLYRLTFYVPGFSPNVIEARLDTTLTETLPPAALVEGEHADGRPDAVLELEIFNGDLGRQTMNRETVGFPVDGLEVFYPVGGFRENFLRVALLMWIKLAALAMVGVWAATFLSFPVAAMVAFGVFFAAEGAELLRTSLESYGVEDMERKVLWWRYPIVWISTGVSATFSFYAELAPTEKLAEGRLVEWGVVGRAVAILGSATAILWAAAAYIFRRRELATYSGR